MEQRFVNAFDAFLKINIQDIKVFGVLDSNKKASFSKKIGILIEMAHEMIQIVNRHDVPENIIVNLYTFIGRINAVIKDIENGNFKNDEELVRQKTQTIRGFEEFYNTIFSLNFNTSNEGTQHLIMYNYLKALSVEDNRSQIPDHDSVKNLIIKEIENRNEQVNDYTKRITKNYEETNSILDEVKLKLSKQTVSDYAKVFEDAYLGYRSKASSWLKYGILTSIGFITILIVFNLSNAFPTEIIDKVTNKLIRIDYTNISLKLSLYGIMIYFIIFAFRQYSTNKHQEVLNQHRMHALNSYKLFTQSITGEDHTSQNSLMMEVARAIYENNQSTGYLGEKGGGGNFGVFDMTKNIIENK